LRYYRKDSVDAKWADIRAAYGNNAQSFAKAEMLLSGCIVGESPEDGKWYPVIPRVCDDGFYAVCMREPMPYRDACRRFGFDVPAVGGRRDS
jgi:hypothetical protein